MEKNIIFIGVVFMCFALVSSAAQKNACDIVSDWENLSDTSKIVGIKLGEIAWKSRYFMVDLKEDESFLNLSGVGIEKLKFPSASSVMAKRLKILDISWNALNELDKSIANMQSIEELNLSFNNLKKIPRSLVKLKNLKKLYLKFNELSKLEKFWVEDSLKSRVEIYIRE